MLAVAVLATFLYYAHAESVILRGVNPDLAVHYSGSGGTFQCISGATKSMPFSRVNDDYCDCPDGSDEPGTSACHNGRFYCRNLGHEPRLLASAFVDDGVCDCCDGTDEPKGRCQNTCLQASAVHKEALRNLILHYESALRTKAEYVTQAQSFKEEMRLKAPTIDDDIARQQAEVDRLKGEVDRLEQEEAAALKAQEEAAALKAQEEAAAGLRAQEEAAAQEAAVGTSTEEGGKLEAPGDHGERELIEGSQQPQAEEREETPEERGRRIASQWTNDPEASAVAGSQGEVNEDHAEADHIEDGHYEEDNHGDYDKGTDLPHEDGHIGHHENEHRRPPRRHDINTPLGEARSRFYAAERVLRDLQTDKENMEAFLDRGLDFGPNDVFLALANKCFSSYQTRWTYEICIFKNAVQKEGHTNTVTVGRWHGFSDDYKQMLFTGGDECWNVGPRSMRVTMTCGSDEQLSDGEEPATCAYASKFTTPIACTEAGAEELRTQLRNLEAFEQEVRAKIEKDEL